MREIYFDFYLNILPFQPNQKLPEYNIIYAMYHILKQQLLDVYCEPDPGPGTRNIKMNVTKCLSSVTQGE